MALPAASADTHAVLQTWQAGKPVIGVMGEFSSGKSTLLNFMLDRDLAHTQVTATPLPPIWFTQSQTAFTKGLRADGTLEDIDLDDSQVDFRANYLAIYRGINTPALSDCDVIDCPGISDPDLGKGALRFLQPYFDFVIWCTPASQAWRQTDKAAYEKLAQSTRENSILVVTRMDKLRNDKDRAKVLKRVRGETGALFGTVLGLETPKAAAVPAEARDDTAEGAWVQTGGYAFATAVTDAISRTGAKLTNETIVTEPSVDETAEEPTKISTFDPQTTLLDTLRSFKEKLRNTPSRTELDHLIAAISADKASYNWDDPVLNACSRIEDDGLEIERVVWQVKAELHAFGASGRLRLDQ